MRKNEAAAIRRCITLLMNEGFHEAIEELARLGKMVYPAAVALRASKPISAQAVAARIKPTRKVRTKPRKGPMRDAAYRRWCKRQHCSLFTIEDPLACFLESDPAHTQNNGMRSKGPDSSCVPLCRKHHQEFDAGHAAFEKKYGVNMKAIAAEHFERYQKEKEQGK